MVTKVNLTPHDVTIIVDGRTETIKSSGLARCSEKTIQVDLIDEWIPVFETEYGEVSGLPEPSEGTIYIVSAIVAKAVKNRADVFIPAKTIRDANGNIIGCIGLSRVS